MANNGEYRYKVQCTLIGAQYVLKGSILAETSEMVQKCFSQLRTRIMTQFPKDETIPFALLANRMGAVRDYPGVWRFVLLGMTRQAAPLRDTVNGRLMDPYPDLSVIEIPSYSERGWSSYLDLDLVHCHSTEFTFYGNDVVDDVDTSKLEKDVDALLYQECLVTETGGPGIIVARQNYKSRDGLYFWMVHNWYGATYPRDMVARVALSRWMGHPVDGNWTAEKLAEELSKDFGEESCIVYLNDDVPPTKELPDA